jgi:glycosyltransferase involved in cell wall biosynthesis
MSDKTPLISIISPFYNVEPYIEDYMRGILSQTYSNLQIICVDDGSPDRCGEILDEYAARDTRVVVIHQENAGVSAAYNHGLDNAKGDYIGFVDPDDWVESDYYASMLAIAQATGADIVISNYFRDYPERCERTANIATIDSVFESRNQAFRYGFEADMYKGFKMFVWNKLFSARFFRAGKNGGLGLRMDEHVATGGDVLLTAQCFLRAERFAYTENAFYHYRIRGGSAVRNTVFAKRVGLNEALERIVDMLPQESFEVETVNLVKRFHTYYCSQLAEFAYSIGDKENLEFSKNEMRKYLAEYKDSCWQHPEWVKRVERILNMKL